MRKKEKKVTNIVSKKSEVDTDSTDILKNNKGYYEQLYGIQFNILDTIGKFPKRQNLPNLTQKIA